MEHPQNNYNNNQGNYGNFAPYNYHKNKPSSKTETALILAIVGLSLIVVFCFSPAAPLWAVVGLALGIIAVRNVKHERLTNPNQIATATYVIGTFAIVLSCVTIAGYITRLVISLGLFSLTTYPY